MINNFQRANLIKLADFIEKKYNVLNFDMTYYMINDDDDHFISACIANATYKCNTIACAIGHGPMAGIDTKPIEAWGNYAKRVFIDTVNKGSVFMFNSAWKNIDNTPLGAAARIRYFLDHEIVFDRYTDNNIFNIDYSAYHIKNRDKSIPDKVEIEPIREPELA